MCNQTQTQKHELSSFHELNEIIVPHKKQQHIYLRKNNVFNCVPCLLSILFLFLYLYKSFQCRIISHKYIELTQTILDHIFYPYHSDLISNINELRLLKNWIKDSTRFSQKDISLRMVYKATVHGDSSENFHKKTDGGESYLIIIKDNNDNIFGGFTSKNFHYVKYFDFSWEFISDSSAFLFNLNEKTMYSIKKEYTNKAIIADLNYCSIFGENGDLVIANHFFTTNSSCAFPKNYGNGNEKECAITNGKRRFLVVEMEVFKVFIDELNE